MCVSVCEGHGGERPAEGTAWESFFFLIHKYPRIPAPVSQDPSPHNWSLCHHCPHFTVQSPPSGPPGRTRPRVLPGWVLTRGASGCRLSSKPLLTADAYELGAGMRKRHKGPEEEHDALAGMGKARGRSQPWDEHEAPSDFMSQVSRPSPRRAALLLQGNCRNGCLGVSNLPPCPEKIMARRLTKAGQPQAEPKSPPLPRGEAAITPPVNRIMV